MRNFILTLILGLFVMACVPIPAAPIDIGNQVAYIVENTVDLPQFPVTTVLTDKCIPAVNYGYNVPICINSICLENPPEILYICGVGDKIDTASFKAVWDWLKDNWWWIASALLAISEGLANSKMKENSIFQLLTGWLRKKAVKPTQ